MADLPGVTVRDPWLMYALSAAFATDGRAINIARVRRTRFWSAMAQGIPVVASAVAARGVDANAGEHLLVGARQPNTWLQS